MHCSCLRRRISRRRIQHHDDERAKNETIRSIAEAIFVMQQSSINRLELDDFGSFGASFQAYKTGYPLPLPLPLSSPDPSTRFSASSSCSSVLCNDDEHLSENGSSCLFRKNVESGPNSWPIATCAAATRVSRSFFSSLQNPVSDRCFEFQRGACDTLSHHPTHRLPRPPSSPVIFSLTEDSKWMKGKLLGKGTLGHVYAGFNSENGKMCAIKEIGIISSPHISKQTLQQLHQDIKVLSQLSHPNILQYHNSQLEEDKLSIYTEYVSGGSVLKLLREYGPFNENIIQSYTRKILCGLAYLHDRNTAHGVIKGANILITPKGEVKLADFALAKHLCSPMLFVQGSSNQMAPVFIKDSGAYGLPADIWSLGCVVIEMATAKPPWSQYEVASAISKIAHDQEIPEIPNELSEEAKSFIKLCLQRNPCSRPTAAQLMIHPFIQQRQEQRKEDKCSW